MSLAIKNARMRYSGDPGLFGTLGRIVGGVARTVGRAGIPGVSTVAGAVGGLLPGGGSRATPPPAISLPPQFAAPQGQGPGSGGIRINPPFLGPRGAGISIFEGGDQPQAGTKLACPTGYHPNKADYWLKDGTFVPAGSRCVKNRRKNPFNPSALSNSIRRIESGKKAATRLSRITIRKKCD